MLAPKNYIRDQVWDEHRRRFPTKKEQEEHQEVLPLPAVDTPQQPSPTFERRKQLQRTKSFTERRRSSLLRQQSFPRGLQDSNRYNHQDFLQDELDFEEKFLLPDEDKRRTECQKSMLPSPSTMLCEVSPRLLESSRKNKANMSNFLFNSSLLWNSFKHSLKPDGAGLTMKVPQEILFIIKVLPGNDRCFDCNSRHDLVWAFVPHGTILCESCGFEHLSSVRDDDILSFSGDLDWKFKELISLLEGGNRALLSFLKQRSIENREHELVATAMKEHDFSSLYNSKTASQYRKFMRKKKKACSSLLTSVDIQTNRENLRANNNSSKPTNGETLEEVWNPHNDSSNDPDEEVEVDDLSPSEYILQIRKSPPTPIENAQLTMVTTLPPNHPSFLPHYFYWGVYDPRLQLKTLSYADDIWKDHRSNKDIAYGNFPTDDFTPAKRKQYEREMLREKVFYKVSRDTMNIFRPEHPVIFELVGRKKGLDKKTMDITCKYIKRIDELKNAIYKKFNENDVSLALKVIRAHANENKTGGCSLHFDPYEEKKDPWKFRIILTLGRWLKLFGFTNSCSKNDPLFTKLFKHGDFIIFNRTSAGSDKKADGSHLFHAAQLLPKPEDMKEDAFIFTLVLDITLINKNARGFWKNPEELLQWLIEEGFVQV
ncbi:hypothetical protein CTEN210_01028 [Chaetoceros tenuissimus]|uniref:Arf-GAP domain-containing protein n=1 Tax=Chaetoceros tenuissimus TaxID=426638 RepID=A0AAD3GZP6_9STRA|nr:hypothetical protein CTEN210_01028 [Chaetoceros tenuissimus]